MLPQVEDGDQPIVIETAGNMRQVQLAYDDYDKSQRSCNLANSLSVTGERGNIVVKAQ